MAAHEHPTAAEPLQRLAALAEAALAACRRGAGTRFAADAVGALERVPASGELGPGPKAFPAISLGA